MLYLVVHDYEIVVSYVVCATPLNFWDQGPGLSLHCTLSQHIQGMKTVELSSLGFRLALYSLGYEIIRSSSVFMPRMVLVLSLNACKSVLARLAVRVCLAELYAFQSSYVCVYI